MHELYLLGTYVHAQLKNNSSFTNEIWDHEAAPRCLPASANYYFFLHQMTFMTRRLSTDERVNGR